MRGNGKEHAGERGLASEVTSQTWRARKAGWLPLYFAEQDNHTVGDLICAPLANFRGKTHFI
jgi:hypothetical protein